MASQIYICSLLETISPCDSVPIVESKNEALANTILTNPDLFKVEYKLNIDCFEQLLESHLNQSFVKSVCFSLR